MLSDADLFLSFSDIGFDRIIQPAIRIVKAGELKRVAIYNDE